MSYRDNITVEPGKRGHWEVLDGAAARERTEPEE